jgi:hypothetical protein
MSEKVVKDLKIVAGERLMVILQAVWSCRREKRFTFYL